MQVKLSKVIVKPKKSKSYFLLYPYSKQFPLNKSLAILVKSTTKCRTFANDFS